MRARANAPPSLTTQAFWLLAAKTAGFALTIALPLVLVRALRQEEFGLYRQAFLVVGTALTVLPLGFGMSAYYFLPRERGLQGAVVAHIFAVYVAVGGLAAFVLAMRPSVLSAMFGDAALEPFAPLLGLVVLTWTIGSFLDIIAVARQDVVASTLFIVASQASKTVAFLVAARFSGSMLALLYAALAQGIGQIAVLLFYLRSAFPRFWEEFDWTILRRQASYAVPLGLSGILLKLQSDVPHYFVAHAFGPATYAIFAVGAFNLPLVGLLRESVGSVMLPRVSRLEQEQDNRAMVGLVARVARKLALVHFPLYVLLLIAGRELIVLLFTNQYAASWPIFAVYLTVVPLGVLVLDPVTRAHADQRYFLLKLRLMLFAATMLVLAFAVDELGPVGTMAVTVAVQVAGTVAAAARLIRVMGLGRPDLAQFAVLGRVAAAACGAGVVSAAVRHFAQPATPLATAVLCGVVYAAVYGAMLVALRVIDRDEMASLLQLVSRRPRAAGPSPTGTRFARVEQR
jgi:O-antigen/teichoic acid export membrane protein